MSKQHQHIRRDALRVLYAADLSDSSADVALQNARQTLAEDDDASDRWPVVCTRVQGVVNLLESIDEEIERLSPNWRIDRMAAVDRNLLRLGIYEILEDITAPLVTINACVELAKEFGTASTPGFINGLLDQLCQDHDIPIDTDPSGSD